MSDPILPASSAGTGNRVAQTTMFSSYRGSAQWKVRTVRICPFDESVREGARLGEDVRCSNRDRRIASILSRASSGDNALPNVGSEAASIRSVLGDVMRLCQHLPVLAAHA